MVNRPRCFLRRLMDCLPYVFIDFAAHALPLSSIRTLTSLNDQLWAEIVKTHLANRQDNELSFKFLTVDDSEKSQVLVRDMSRAIDYFNISTLQEFQKQELKYQRITKLTLSNRCLYSAFPLLDFDIGLQQVKVFVNFSCDATITTLELKGYFENGPSHLEDMWKIPVKTLTSRLWEGSNNLDLVESWHLENNPNLEEIYCQDLSRLNELYTKWNSISEARNLRICGHHTGDRTWIQKLGFQVLPLGRKDVFRFVFMKTHSKKNVKLTVIGIPYDQNA